MPRVLTNEKLDLLESIANETIRAVLETGAVPPALGGGIDVAATQAQLEALLTKHRFALSDATLGFLFDLIKNTLEDQPIGDLTALSDQALADLAERDALNVERLRDKTVGARIALLEDLQAVGATVLRAAIVSGLTAVLAL